MKPPRQLRLFGQSVQLDFVDVGQQIHHDLMHQAIAGSTSRLGTTESDIQRIGIRRGQGFHQERSTVIHEILHCIDALAGHTISTESWDSDEGRARHALYAAYETGILDLIRSNPELIAWLAEPEP